MNESELYAPLKRFLEAQQYEVKGEVQDCDAVAVRAGEPPVVVELKRSLNLQVLLQAVDRLALTPLVYIGVAQGSGALQQRRRQVMKLLRMLGLGLLVIEPDAAGGRVEVLLDPGTYRPRPSRRRRERLLGEFVKRVGDPNLGGTAARRGIMTSYRQRVLDIAAYLERQGPSRPAHIARTLQEPRAGAILSRDVYGWFDRISRGMYTLSPRGERELPLWRDAARPS